MEKVLQKDKLFPEHKQVVCQIVDIDTAEILYDVHLKKLFFASCGGEDYLRKVIDSFINGLHEKRNLSLRLSVFPFINQTEADLFGLDITQYPCALTVV